MPRLKPIDDWEADMWSLWERIKKGLDKQEKQRKKKDFPVWIAKAQPLFDWLTDIDAAVRMKNPARCAMSYGYWLSAKGLESWIPITDGPLVWTPPGRGRAGEADVLAASQAKYEAFKDEIKRQRKENLKRWRKEQREADKAAKKGSK